MDFLNYITKDALILIPVLWIIGTVIKNTNYIKDNLIPIILIPLGIILTNCLLGFSTSSVIQGILVGGACVGLNQVKVQLNKDKE